MAQEIITLENLAAEVAKLRGELATWKALAIKQDRLSTAQMLAVNSGATAGKIAQIATNASDIAALQQIASSAFRVVKVAQLPASGEPYIMYLVPQTDGETLNYCNEYLWIDNAWELVGTTGAMANNGELQIIVNGVTVGTFTANQATDSTASITVPTDTSQLTNGAGYVDATALATALASKQNSLSLTQLAAVNSGITSTDVAQIGANTTAIAGKQDALTTSQLAAVNSGITSADVTQIGTNTGNIATNSAAIISLQGSKQNALSAAQLLAVNSGITSSLVTQIGTNQSDITTLNTALGQSLTPSADNTYSLGGASFRYANVYAVTFTGDLTGTASKAIADEDGTSIKTGYVNVAGNQTVSGQKTWTGFNIYEQAIRIAKTSGDSEVEIVNKNIDSTSNATTEMDDIRFMDKNGKITGGLRVTYNNTRVQNSLSARSWSSDGTAYSNVAINIVSNYQNNAAYISVTSDFLPVSTNSLKLGNASYQWSSVYAQTYYYGTTAFTDKFVTTDTIQTINASKTINSDFPYLYIKNPNKEKGVAPSERQWGRLNFTDKNNATIAGMEHSVYSNGVSQLAISINNLYSNGTLNPSGTSESCAITLELSSSGEKSIVSGANASTDLGTSTNKWKTLNGINPGALSLPAINTSIAVDTTNWVYDGATFNEIKINNATQTISGWLYIIINNASSDDVIVVRYAGSDSGNLTYAQYKSGLSYVSLVAPIMPGVKTYVASRNAFSTIKIYHSLGNV